MTVSELIQKLSEFDPNATLVCEQWYTIKTVRQADEHERSGYTGNEELSSNCVVISS